MAEDVDPREAYKYKTSRNLAEHLVEFEFRNPSNHMTGRDLVELYTRWIDNLIAEHEQAARIDEQRVSEMAGALKARDVMNVEMGVDCHWTGAYLIDRYHEKWGKDQQQDRGTK